MPEVQVNPQKLIRKIFLHVLWLPFLLGVVSIIDRTNVGYAALRMNAELGFTATMYGLGAGILFLGYFLFEIPNNMLLRKLGSRFWLARIGITWGILAAANALITNEATFYIIRFLLGVAEAGLFPGVILYITFWFPAQAKARAVALFMTAVPIASIIAAPISGWLVGFDQIMGIKGWQFMFVVWGLPAVIIGIILLVALPNGPDDVKWMADDEKVWLKAQLEVEAKSNIDEGRHRFGDAFRERNTWVFSAIYFCYATGQYGMIFFLPQILQRFNYSPAQVGLLATLPYIAGVTAMILVSRHSDKTGERLWHFTIPMFVSAVCLLGAGLTMSIPVVAIILLTLTGAGIFSALGNFWARPTAMLTGAAAAAGFAIINSLGNIGGFAGPYAMGFLQDLAGGSNVTGLFLMSLLAVLGGLLSIFAIKGHKIAKVAHRT